MKYESKYIGKFHLNSGKVLVTDPCYDKPYYDENDHCSLVVSNVKNGEWKAYVEYEMGRVSSLRIRYGDPNYRGRLASSTPMTLIGKALVDSGQCGFYDLAEYPNDSGDYYDEKSFYRNVCDQVGLGERAATFKNGAFSMSGCGDGGYNVYQQTNTKGEVVALDLLYMEDEEDEDEFGEEE